MKIVLYCRHTMGAGHFFRTLEIAKKLQDHDTVLVWGGTPIPAHMPSHIRQFRLREVMMDERFKVSIEPETGQTVYQAKKQMWKTVYRIMEQENPDVILIELYPFGRKAFRFEIEPVLKAIRAGGFAKCRVMCSLRDILVEKKKQSAYEERVLTQLNRYFDALLVHSDPEVIPLDLTFSRMADIRVPIAYTGYITAKPSPSDGARLRQELRIGPTDNMAVASAGGGKVGFELLEAVILAYPLISVPDPLHLFVFSGPFMDRDQFDRLARLAANHPRIHLARFTTRFSAYLAASDVSISLAGYNTLMNLVAAEIPAWVYPFDQNREQRMRCEKFASTGRIHILSPEALDPHQLAQRLETTLQSASRPGRVVNLDGAVNTAKWLARCS